MTHAWITAEALADANVMLPGLQISHNDVRSADAARAGHSPLQHGDWLGQLGTVRYCACCDAYQIGQFGVCHECSAPWERADA